MLVGINFRPKNSLRRAILEICHQRKERCEVNHFNVSHLDSLFANMSRQWFNLHPDGDSPTRNSFYDTLQLNTIPVVFNHRYFSDPRSLPWGDIVELDKVRLIIPASELMANKQNVVDILKTSFQSNRKRYVHKSGRRPAG